MSPCARGVSTKTVSRVFNDDPHVLPDTRALVETAMRELNYVPNALATTFRAGRASVIGVAVPDVVDPFFAAIARAVEDTARSHGLSTLVTSLGEDPDDERPALESLLGRQLTGLVIAPVGTDHSWLERWRGHTPIVFVDRAPAGVCTPTPSPRTTRPAPTWRRATSSRTATGASPTSATGCTCRPRPSASTAGAARSPRPGSRSTNSWSSRRCRTVGPRHPPSKTSAPWPNRPRPCFSANARSSMALAHVLRGAPMPFVGFGDFPMADTLTPLGHRHRPGPAPHRRARRRAGVRTPRARRGPGARRGDRHRRLTRRAGVLRTLIVAVHAQRRRASAAPPNGAAPAADDRSAWRIRSARAGVPHGRPAHGGFHPSTATRK